MIVQKAQEKCNLSFKQGFNFLPKGHLGPSDCAL